MLSERRRHLLYLLTGVDFGLPASWSSQLLQQRLRFLQIARLVTLGKPAVDRSEKLASLFALTLIAPLFDLCRQRLMRANLDRLSATRDGPI
jgi:hypothetical protein